LPPTSRRKSSLLAIAGAQINFIHRRGKHILFDLDNGRTLITHLRMSGRFMLLDNEQDEPKFTHASFQLEGNDRLIFQDQRHFGFMKIVETTKLFQAKELAKLAPEPFSDEFSDEYFRKLIKGTNRIIKMLCLIKHVSAASGIFTRLRHSSSPEFAYCACRHGIGDKSSALRNAIVQVMNETWSLERTFDWISQISAETFTGPILTAIGAFTAGKENRV
jgi:hypothetical protein